MNHKDAYVPLQVADIDLGEEDLYESPSSYTARKHASRRRAAVLAFYLCAALVLGLVVGSLSKSRDIIKSYIATEEPKSEIVVPLSTSFHVVGNATNSLRGEPNLSRARILH